MEEELAQTIAYVFSFASVLGQVDGYKVEKLAGRGEFVPNLPESNYLNNRRNPEDRLGVYSFTKNEHEIDIGITVWRWTRGFYLMVVNNRKQSAVCEICDVVGDKLHWSYAVKKHKENNGVNKNPLRIQAFIKEYGSSDVYFTIPNSFSNLSKFLDELFNCVAIRLKVEAAFKPKKYVIFEFSDDEMADIDESVENDYSQNITDVEITPLKPEYEDMNISNKRPKRHIMYYKTALARAGYKCEYNNEDRLFKRSNGLVDYTEPHHLIPLNHQDKFECSLDNVANIVSLCSHCHNLLHYGRFEDKKPILQKLYRARKNELAHAGIVLKSISDLYKYYK